MRNLWIFISKYNAFFFFIIFFTLCIVLTIKNNAYQRSVTLNSTNKIVGDIYNNLNIVKKYVNLGAVNDSLANENARLKTELFAIKNPDTSKDVLVKDTAGNPAYIYLAARVIKNSITLRNNIITINKGKGDGVRGGMAVISPGTGVVGFIWDVSEHLATIRSLLHQETYISVRLQKSNAVGSLVWGERNGNYRRAYIKDVPNHFKVGLGDTVVTSGYSFFPPGIPVGKISNTGMVTGGNFKTLEIILFNDFSTLQYVYVVKDKFAQEQKDLETKIPDEE